MELGGQQCRLAGHEWFIAMINLETRFIFNRQLRGLFAGHGRLIADQRCI